MRSRQRVRAEGLTMRRDMIRYVSDYHRAVARRDAARSLAIGLAELLALASGAIGIVAIIALIALI